MKFAGLTLVLVLAVAGCSANSKPDGKGSTASANPSAAAVAPSVAPVSVPADVAKKFGEDKASAGWTQVVGLTAALAFQPALVGKHSGFTAADFAKGRDQMTDNARTLWDNAVTKALAGDAKAKSALQTLVFYDVDPSVTFPADNSLVTSQDVTVTKIAVDGERLRVDMVQNAVLACSKDGKPLKYTITKTLAYELTPAPKGAAVQWLIDAWNGNFGGKISK